MGTYRFSLIPGRFAVVRLAPHEHLPEWALGAGALESVTRTADELSIVCPAERVPADARAEPGWSAVKLAGPFPFEEVGVLASFAAPLANAGISLFALSTFDTDYILVKTASLDAAVAALEAAGHALAPSGGPSDE